MIKLYTQSTHLKVVYDEATVEECEKSEKILTTRFCAKDTSLSNTTLVKRKIATDVVSFYNVDYQILPIGFLKYLEYYYEKKNIEYTIKEMRKFPPVDKIFMRQLLNGEIELNGEIPREYQTEAVYEAVKNRGGGIELPTASGKTLIMALLCKAYAKSRILIIENTIDLIQQTYEKFSKYGFTEDEMGVIQGANDDDSKRITLLSLQSYEKAFNLFPYIRVVIADEAHESARTITSEKVIYSCQNAPVKIGVSATMRTIDNPYEGMRLIGNIGPIVYKKEIKEQIDANFISQVKVEIHSYPCDQIPIVGSWADIYEKIKVSNKNPEEDLIERGYEIVQEGDNRVGRKMLSRGDEYNHFIANSFRNQKIINIVDKYAKQGKRILVLFNRIEHGEILQSMYKDGILIHGEDDLKSRKEAELQLREKPGTVVFASGIWKKGIDIEEMDVFINATAGHSTVNVIQKLGRVIRKSRTTEKGVAIAIDFDDSKLSPIGRNQTRKRVHIYEEVLQLPVEFVAA